VNVVMLSVVVSFPRIGQRRWHSGRKVDYDPKIRGSNLNTGTERENSKSNNNYDISKYLLANLTNKFWSKVNQSFFERVTVLVQ